MVLRLMLKQVLTTALKSFSSQPRDVRSLRLIRITAERTFGGGVNEPGSTLNRYSMSYQACSSTERMP